MYDQEGKKPQQVSKNAADGVFSLGKGLLLSATITGYILGPLVLFGLLGFFLDRHFETKPWILLASLAIAFVSTNILIYKRSSQIAKKFVEEPKQEQTDKN